jgi:hypothetical protein
MYKEEEGSWVRETDTIVNAYDILPTFNGNLSYLHTADNKYASTYHIAAAASQKMDASAASSQQQKSWENNSSFITTLPKIDIIDGQQTQNTDIVGSLLKNITGSSKPVLFLNNISKRSRI